MQEEKRTKKKEFLNPEVIKHLRFTWMVIAFLSVTIAIFSLLFGQFYYFIDLFSHFQLQYTLWGIFVLFVGAFIGVDHKKLLFGTGAILIYFVYMLYPLSLHPITAERISSPDIFYMNTEYDNRETDQILEQIKGFNPDTVALVEANDEIIASLKDIYGDPVERSGAGAYSCAIFTRLQYKRVDLYDWRYEYPVCATEIMDKKIILIHPHPPLNKEYFEAQERYFSQISSLLEQYDTDREQYILIGDFNSTSYNWMFDKYFGEIHERNIYSWSVGNLNTLPIDHALSNEEIKVFRAPKSSSDHAGLVVLY